MTSRCLHGGDGLAPAPWDTQARPLGAAMQRTALFFLLGASACSLGKVADRQTMLTAAPSILSLPDVELACATGAALAPVVGALGEGKRAPHKALVMTLVSAGMCMEPVAWEAELARLGALHAGQGAAVQDALEAERRAHDTAARRYLAAWSHLEAAFGRVGDGCPTLDPELNDDLLYLLGLSSGVLAVLHDRAAGGSVGVALDVPRQVERATVCLDNGRFWGAPRALQASVWLAVPGAGPEGIDPKAVLAESAALGDAAGVRLARAFQAQALGSSGDDAGLLAALGAHAASVGSQPAAPAFALLDAYAHRIVQHESDRLWAAAAGHRTPAGALGQRPGAAAAPPAGEGWDDLLDALLPGTDAPPADAPAPAASPTESK